jgi:ATP-binding cassette subfamily C protein
VSTSTIARSSTVELSNVTLGVLLPLALLCSELALVAGALVVLLAMQPSAAAVLLVMTTLISLPVFVLNRKRLSLLGTRRHALEDERARFAQETTGGIREVKVYGMEQQMLDSLGNLNRTYATVMTRVNFLQNFPRIYFEAAGLCALLVICGVELYHEIPPAQILTFLVLAGFVAFRALPSVAKILSQLQSLRFYRPSLANFAALLEELGHPAEPQATGLAGAAMAPWDVSSAVSTGTRLCIEAVGAAYAYGTAAPPVFVDASFCLHAGQLVGLVGASGAGKSTLLDCIIGLRELTAGSISICDERTGQQIRPQVSYVPQTPVVFDGSVWRNLTLAPNEPQDVPPCPPSMTSALQTTGFADLMQARGLDLASRITESGRNLSGGQRQRLALSRALLRRGDVLILDEATSALDTSSEERIYEAIRRDAGDAIVILVTHRPELLKLCDQIIEIQPGGRLQVRATANAPSCKVS